MQTIIVTGGAGFIGSNFVRIALRNRDWRLVVIDKLTYAGNHLNLREVADDPRYSFIHADIADQGAVAEALDRWQPDYVVNFAAETHVDRSIDGPRSFLMANVMGTFSLLEATRHYWAGLEASRRDGFRFLQISTDEVYGTLGDTGFFSENSVYSPNSPYAASKASADHFVRAYHETFGLPTLISNCSNNYGFNQYPEKLIPLTISNAIAGKALPIYGDGKNIRDWLFVGDHCEALLTILARGRVGEKYNVGGRNERTNLEVVSEVCAALEEVLPAETNEALAAKGCKSYRDLITLVPDRPGHDRRYAIDCSRIERELGWTARISFEMGLRVTVRWYLLNGNWCQAVQRGHYDGRRLGLSAARAAER
ncbi:MAG: dTDP-glucose 4,6-dehydratase [Candidatus Binatus sp.]|jgi:dTDP-glucose 4,6-dehydratase